MTFEPYHEWLGLPRSVEEPNYYELLGLGPDAKTEDIQAAFRGHYARIRKYQVGERGADAVRLLQELSRAHQVLVQWEKRCQYHLELGIPDPAAFANTPQVEEPEEEVVLQPKWHLRTRDGRQLGPLEHAQVRQAVQSRQIDHSTYVWCEGWPDWKLAGEEFPELRPKKTTTTVDRQPLPQQPAPQQPVRMVTSLRQLKSDRFGPYVVRDASPAARKFRFSVLLILGVLGIQAIALSSFMGTHRGWPFYLSLAGIALGLPLFAVALLEGKAWFNSPPINKLRRKQGDESTRKLFLILGLLMYAAGWGWIVGISAQVLFQVIRLSQST